MPINRQAAVDYAAKYWNRVTDDDKFWISSEAVMLADKRKSMKAPAADGWEAFFVPDGSGGENAVFRRTVSGKIEDMPDPIATMKDLDDCTHYVCRCLLKEGIVLKETPRANELAEAMLASPSTKTLALRTTRAQGQKIIDSGVFKPGDLISYYKTKKYRYGHSSMYVGKQTGATGDPGGMTCHSLCRFQGKTKAWNGADDDAWFIHEEPGFLYTLFHFSEDDTAIGAATLTWLPGWWEADGSYYYVNNHGRAYATGAKPKSKTQKLSIGTTTGYYFQTDKGLVFIWSKKKSGDVTVETWAAPSATTGAARSVDSFAKGLTRVF